MKTSCTVVNPMYEVNNKKYIDIGLPPDVVVEIHKIHAKSYDRLTRKNVRIALDGNTLKVKVPVRNGRIMCDYTGSKTPYELTRGDQIDVELIYNGPWSYGDFCGLAWTFNLIKTPNLPPPPVS